MIITAKFASVCPCCSNRIAVGVKVEWAKGSPARHVSCAGAKPVYSYAIDGPARSSYAGGRRTGCRCGSREGVQSANDCRTCRHDA